MDLGGPSTLGLGWMDLERLGHIESYTLGYCWMDELGGHGMTWTKELDRLGMTWKNLCRLGHTIKHSFGHEQLAEKSLRESRWLCGHLGTP
jgi:hypothetical protein